MRVNILLVDDHRMFREGLRLIIGREFPDASVVAEADTVADALRHARELRPDLVVMDIHLPDGNGLEASRQILAEIPATRIIVLSAEPSLRYVREALRIGVSGYLLKSNAPEELPLAIRAVMAGNLHLCAEAGRAALEDYKTTLVRHSPAGRAVGARNASPPPHRRGITHEGNRGPAPCRRQNCRDLPPPFVR